VLQDWLPVAKLTAFGAPGLRGSGVVLKAYLDGSGSSDYPASRFLTLAVIMGRDQDWTTMEGQWGAALGALAPYSHMRELLRGDGPFSGWQDFKKVSFVNGLFNAIGSFARQSFLVGSLTIDLSDYRNLQASLANPQTAGQRIKPPEAVCVDYCMSIVHAHPAFTERTEVIFDMNEPFIKFCERPWSRNKRNPSHWAYHVSSVRPADMRDIRPLQVADLIAWSSNRYYTQLDTDPWWHNIVKLHVLEPFQHEAYNTDKLKQHPKFLEWDGGLPPEEA